MTQISKRIRDVWGNIIYFEGNDSALVNSGRIVDAYVDGALNGFAINENGGRIEYIAILGPSASNWVMAHELGHILLSGGHSNERDNLMFHNESGSGQTHLRHRKLWYENERFRDNFSQWERMRRNVTNNNMREDL